MKSRSTQRWVMGVAVGLAGILLGCQRNESPATAPTSRTAAGGVQTVVACNGPVHYFAQRISGDAVRLLIPQMEGDPAFWRPSDDDVADLQKADAILLNGASYEKWLLNVTLSPGRLFDTSAGFRDQWIEIKEAVTHSHGPEGEHAHTGTAFTTWLDFSLAQQQALAVKDALAQLLPEKSATFEAGYQSLAADLDGLDRAMRGAAEKLGDQPLVVSHPVYDYWARRYGLNIVALHWEPDAVPDEKAMADLAAILENHPAKIMIWEGTPVAEAAAKVAEKGLRSIVFDPAGNLPDEGDWLTIMKANIAALQAD